MPPTSSRFAWALVACLLAPAAAAAQEDQEGVLVEDEEPDKRAEPEAPERNPVAELPGEALASVDRGETLRVGELDIGIEASSEIHAIDNLDGRAIDESSDQAVIDSDDRRDFGHTDLAATVRYRAHRDVWLDAQAKYDVFWRDDQLGRSANDSGDLGIYQLFFTQTLADTADFGATLRMGRQPFRIGGVPHDYMLEGTLDAITAELDFRGLGRVRVLAIDFFAGNDLPERGYQYYRPGSETVFGLRGETNTLRSGAVYEIDGDAIEGLPITAKAYYFYASIGGGPIEESGADITYGGVLGNFRDNDYQHMFGGRVKYTLSLGPDSSMDIFGELARSAGIDRKSPVERDVDTVGTAYGGGITADLGRDSDLGFTLGADFYHFDGADYGSDGLEFERGFVGFRGARVGGLAIGRHAAWRPSAHLDLAGLDHTPYDTSRSAGTRFAHAKAGARFGRTELAIDWWWFQDTSHTFLATGNIEAIPDPPFGRSRLELAAQERAGKALGQEIDLSIRHNFNEVFGLYATYAVFTPGDGLEIEIDRVAGRRDTALGGTEALWAFRLGGAVEF